MIVQTKFSGTDNIQAEGKSVMTNLHSRIRELSTFCAMMVALLWTFSVHADDWPQWRGANRDGVWRESGILESFPVGGVKTR